LHSNKIIIVLSGFCCCCFFFDYDSLVGKFSVLVAAQICKRFISEIWIFQDIDAGISPRISKISHSPKKDAGSGPEA